MESPLGTGDSEWRRYVFPAYKTPITKNLSSTKVPAKYFIGGLDEFDGAIPRLSVPLTTRVFINTGSQRARGTETTTPSDD